MNKRFLDHAIKSGQEFSLATPPHLAKVGSFYAREVEYLISRGYQPATDGMRLIPPGPPGG